MRSISSELQAALAARTVVARNFVWLSAKHRETLATEAIGFWNDVGDVTAEVVDGLSRLPVERSFVGSGALIAMGDLEQTADGSIRTLTITLSPITEAVEQAIRLYDAKNAPVQVHRGIFDPQSRRLVEAPQPRFVGFVDGAPVVTPPVGGSGSVQLNCVSQSRELTRTNTATRSDGYLRSISGGADGFYQYSNVVGSWPLFWGQAEGSLDQ
jgi:hypothetical protein